jgi:hypothetical protein
LTGGIAIAAATLAVVAACTKAGGPTAQAASNPSCPAPAAVPAGFGYPQSQHTVMRWVSSRNIKAAREHGWGLFAALNTMSGNKSVWRSWCTETQAFAPGGAADTLAAANTEVPHGAQPMRRFKSENGLTTGADPINFSDLPVYPIPAAVQAKYAKSGCVLPPSGDPKIATLANGAQFQNNGDVMIAGVIYNDPAYQWIRNKQLYQAQSLQAMLPPANQNRQMAAMPVGSIVLKPMLWPVPAQGYAALPVWDNLTTDNGRYSGFEIKSQWPRAVAITANPTPAIAAVDAKYLYGPYMKSTPNRPLGPVTYQGAPVVDLARFFHFKPDLSTMQVCDRALLDASSWYANGRMFQQGDYLALVAMHIMTKEQPAWTFQSVWWSDRAGSGPYAADRPTLPNAKGPWQNYLMASTYGWTQAGNPAKWPIAYNPYIELAADHPIDTNCMNCHHRAAWPENGTGYLAPNGPGALDKFSYGQQPVFNGLIGVDALWSIADRVPSPSASPSASGSPPK